MSDQIEMTLAHLVKQMEELNEVVVRQDGEIARLTAQMKLLMEREAAREQDGAGGVVIGDERPPHY